MIQSVEEKAEELVNKMFNTQLIPCSWSEAKQSALIAVDEILCELDDNYDTLHSSDRKFFWHEVKQEIEKL